MALTSSLPMTTGSRDIRVPLVLSVVSLAFIAALVMRMDALPALALLVSLVAAVAVWFYPALATVLAVFLVFANLPTAMSASIPGAKWFAASFAIPLAIPFLHRLFRGARPIFDVTFGLMAAYLFILLVSAFVAVDWRVAVLTIGQYAAEGLALYWLLLQAIRTQAMMRRVLWTVVLTGAALASLGLYQEVSGDYRTQFAGLAKRQLRHDIARAQARAEADEHFTTSQSNGAYVQTSQRAAGPIGDPNRFAQILLVAWPFAVLLAYRSKSRLAQCIGMAASALIGAGIGLTYSRGAFLTIALLLAGLAIWRGVHPIKLVLGAVVATMVLVALAPNYFTRMGTILNTSALVNDQAGVEPDGAMRGRATEVLAAMWAFTDHPWLGVGPGQYVPYYSQRYQQRSDIKFRQLSQPREAHNLYASIAAETGVPGLVVFLAIFVSLFVRLKRARHYWLERDHGLADLALACQFSLLGYLGTGIFLHMAYERYHALLLAVAAAAVQVLHLEMKRREAVTVAGEAHARIA